MNTFAIPDTTGLHSWGLLHCSPSWSCLLNVLSSLPPPGAPPSRWPRALLAPSHARVEASTKNGGDLPPPLPTEPSQALPSRQLFPARLPTTTPESDPRDRQETLHKSGQANSGDNRSYLRHRACGANARSAFTSAPHPRPRLLTSAERAIVLRPPCTSSIGRVPCLQPSKNRNHIRGTLAPG